MIGLETKILTVAIHEVQGELQVRQAFGWRLAQTSARSFATGGSFAGVGTHVGGGLVVGGGQVALNNAHYTDLVLERAHGPLTQRLAQLEAQYDSVTYLPNASHWSTIIVAGLVFLLGLFGGIAVAVQLGMDSQASVHPAFFLVPLVVGIVLGVLVTRIRQRGRIQKNEEAEVRQLKILHQARGGPA